MLLIAIGFALFSRVGLHTPYWFIVIALVPLMSGMAMSMSPMTAAIMSAVPARRAGAGSAMNDATRELGAALGVAVLGSIAASQYTSHLHQALGRLPASARSAAGSSIAGALHAAEQLSAPAARAFSHVARAAFVDGIHVASLFGVGLALIAALLTNRFLPHTLVPEGALHSPIDAIEDIAERGLDGVPPTFAEEDGAHVDDAAPDRAGVTA